METQRKKNEAAKKDGPVLDQPIDIPSPPDPTPRPETRPSLASFIATCLRLDPMIEARQRSRSKTRTTSW